MSAQTNEMVECPVCQKQVKRQGLGTHTRLAHQMTAEQRAAQSRLAVTTKKGAAKPMAQKNAERAPRRRLAAVEDVSLPPVAPSTNEDQSMNEPSAHDVDQALVVLGKIKRVLGVDPVHEERNKRLLAEREQIITGLQDQIVAVTAERDEAIQRADELQTKLQLMREVFDQ